MVAKKAPRLARTPKKVAASAPKKSPSKATESKSAGNKVKPKTPGRATVTKTQVSRAKKVAPTKAATGKPVARGPKSSGSTASVEVGKRAPKFELVDQTGALVRSRDLEGAPYVLYFYPKDNTPGCTREACDFRDHFGMFKKARVRVFGVSPDSAKTHSGFAQKHELPFPLLVDADKTLANAYGVWAKKQNYGREYFGIVRSTFVIDGAGVVRKEWRNVRVDGHVEEVLKAAKEV